MSVRVVAKEFDPTRNMRRIVKRNADIAGEMKVAVPTSEQYSLFRRYLDSRHRDGGMADMTALDYATMIEDSHVETRLIEYRRRGPGVTCGRTASDLIAVALTDVLADGLSMVYSFYEPERSAAFVRHLYDPRPHRARPPSGPAACLSRLLGRGLAENGL